nr:uncharacterized protein LOC109424137 [Aedes albopictus]
MALSKSYFEIWINLILQVIAAVLLISVLAVYGKPTSVDEAIDAPVADLVQTSQAVAEQDPKVEAIKETAVEMSDENKEAMDNAETFGFGYYRTYYPRVYIPSVPVMPHYVYPAVPHYPGLVHYY